MRMPFMLLLDGLWTIRDSIRRPLRCAAPFAIQPAFALRLGSPAIAGDSVRPRLPDRGVGENSKLPRPRRHRMKILKQRHVIAALAAALACSSAIAAPIVL